MFALSRNCHFYAIEKPLHRVEIVHVEVKEKLLHREEIVDVAVLIENI